MSKYFEKNLIDFSNKNIFDTVFLIIGGWGDEISHLPKSTIYYEHTTRIYINKLLTYVVTFQSNKIDFHGDEPFWISAEIFNVLHKVSTELVATFEDTENHNIIVSNVLHNIFGQSFCPGAKKIKDKITLDADSLSSWYASHVVTKKHYGDNLFKCLDLAGFWSSSQKADIEWWMQDAKHVNQTG